MAKTGELEYFPTPLSRDYRSGKVSPEKFSKNSRPLNEFILSHPDQDLTSGHTNTRGLLNPAWVAQLMGTTLERIFSECSEMPLWNKPQS